MEHMVPVDQHMVQEVEHMVLVDQHMVQEAEHMGLAFLQDMQVAFTLVVTMVAVVLRRELHMQQEGGWDQDWAMVPGLDRAWAVTPLSNPILDVALALEHPTLAAV